MNAVDNKTEPGSVNTYTVGFILSVVLTIAAFMLVERNILEGWNLLFALAGLAISQLIVQLVFFLHLAHEKKPRLNLTSLLFAVMVIIIIVFVSLWIMQNLNRDHGIHGHPVNEKDETIIEDEGY